MANKGAFGTNDRQKIRRRFQKGDVVNRGRESGDSYDRFQLKGDGTRLYGDGRATPVQQDPDGSLFASPIVSPTLGFWTVPPFATGTAIGLTTQLLHLSYFTAPMNLTVTKPTVNVAAYSATTHTYSGIGIYQEEPDGSITFLSASDETGAPPTFIGSAAYFTTTSPAFTPALSFVRGRIYAVGYLTLFTGGAIQLSGGLLCGDVGNLRPEMNLGPGVRRCVAIASQTSFPATISNATLAAGTAKASTIFSRLVP